ncbi:type II toxin-antitoxin system ParD family antitoxin [Sphingomonas sp. BIUV-7]|uniref:Type II toxin-antitoxin system ParD family antitoxin n=1 Tax=Sphingomonas natans TaxID=3063330 RepID=A0ABT8YE31_9SPHN|nr:type II toxin-antitoxin system ParD family antitoxin [Sphingomonas sp. BIUV-7]MDO6416604.1 type II toxin-antitoxin system ParD family antitoxin [Sphingomonas sp. BIUV-7]
MTISIPEALKSWAEQRVAEGRYTTTSDYVADLVRRDQENREKFTRLLTVIDEGLTTGETDPFAYLKTLRRRVGDVRDPDADGDANGKDEPDDAGSDRSH